MTLRELYLMWKFKNENDRDFQSILLAEVHNVGVMVASQYSKSRLKFATPDDYNPHKQSRKLAKGIKLTGEASQLEKVFDML